MTQVNLFSSIPIDQQMEIFGKLWENPAELMKARLVCRDWNKFIEKKLLECCNEYWKRYQTLPSLQGINIVIADINSESNIENSASPNKIVNVTCFKKICQLYRLVVTESKKISGYKNTFAEIERKHKVVLSEKKMPISKKEVEVKKNNEEKQLKIIPQSYLEDLGQVLNDLIIWKNKVNEETFEKCKKTIISRKLTRQEKSKTLPIKKTGSLEVDDESIGKDTKLTRSQKSKTAPSSVYRRIDIDDNGANLRCLPSQVFKEDIQIFNAKNNELTSLPIEILICRNLTEIDLTGNQLKQIPKELFKLKNLETLILEGNQIEELPSQIDSLVNLTFLRMASCELTVLPDEIGNLKELKHLDLFNNKLTTLPETIVNLNLTTSQLLNNLFTKSKMPKKILKSEKQWIKADSALSLLRSKWL